MIDEDPPRILRFGPAIRLLKTQVVQRDDVLVVDISFVEERGELGPERDVGAGNVEDGDVERGEGIARRGL